MSTLSEKDLAPRIYDRRGIPIERGDILKVYHFTAALRRRRHYMYKQALDVFYLGQVSPVPYIKFDHLAMDGQYYWEICDGRVLPDYEIVQSIDCMHEERPRRALTKEPQP